MEMKTHIVWDNIQLNLLTLSFPEDIEATYRAEHFLKSLRHVRVAMALAVFFFAVFGILDAWIVPEAKYQLWFIRYGLFCPFVLSVFLFSFSRHFKKYSQYCIASVVLAAGLGITAMILLAPENNSYYAGNILVLIFGYTFFELRFLYATAAGAMIVVAYEIAAIILTNTPIPILINNNFFFLTANFIGMFACYSIDLYSRKAFLQAHLLEKEKIKVKKANRELGDKVADRTAKLLQSNKVLRQQISERNDAEDRLRESREKYRTILETMEEGYYEYDTSGNLQFCNDSFLSITGYDREEMMGRHYKTFTKPKDVTKVFRAFNNVYVSQKPFKEFEWRIRRKDGGDRYLEASMSPIKSAEGLAHGFRGIVRDVSDRFHAEESLKEAYQELKLTQSQLVQSGKLASIGELAAGVAHELNQPLMVVRGIAQLLIRQIQKGKLDAEAISKQLEPVDRNTKRMMNIINHLRVFSRQSKAEFYAVDMNNVIEESFLMVGEQLRLRNIEVIKNLDPELPKIKGDTNQLEQVVLNLITNARDAITGKNGDEGGDNPQGESIEIVTSKIAPDDNYIGIHVKDTGTGIKKKDLDSIFDPFYSTKEVGKGTGLGLSISYGIIHEHNGNIEVSNTGPDGTTFSIRLPIFTEQGKGDSQVHANSE